MVERKDKQIMPHEEPIEILNLGSEENKKEIKIGTTLSTKGQQSLIKLFQEYKDVFSWSYEDMLVKGNLSNASILLPPVSGKPLIRYLSIFENSMGCVLGQHDQSGKKERAIYYLSKKFTNCKILLFEFDIQYVSQNVVKGSIVADFIVRRASDEYESLNFDFPDEDLMAILIEEAISSIDEHWNMNFVGASNSLGHGIGAILVSPSGKHYHFTSQLNFDCTNNMVKYKACIMGLRAAIESKVKTLKVYGDLALVTYQLRGEWETKDTKLVEYHKLVLDLIKNLRM
ncbi:uncharacterized protein LOC120130192 [Hibiscus syriacus]|uniref:uncharacterized protein LOC120130192 n=1 Tax=Hibiscus syriacus TaxID=106335 RepID=UPI001921EC02|nr:uncharacterized protein LOC120130192 [Hibiscus syriacus]